MPIFRYMSTYPPTLSVAASAAAHPNRSSFIPPHPPMPRTPSAESADRTPRPWKNAGVALAICFLWMTCIGSALGEPSNRIIQSELVYPPTSVRGQGAAPRPFVPHYAVDQPLDLSAVATAPNASTPIASSASTWDYPPTAVEAPWTWQVLPEGQIYRAYLAGEKESRFRSVWAYQEGQGWIWDITLGGRVGLLRYGSADGGRPTGWQLDIEGAGMPRLDLENDRDLVSADFRFGIPLSYGDDVQQIKFGFYHLSSHLGDEFLENNPGYTRYNYSRDVLVLGYSVYPQKNLRLYAEAGWSYDTDVCEPWEFQFGIDFSPADCTGFRGAPFLALNGAMRQEVDFGGNIVVQTGWAWRGSPTSGLFRAGFEYFQGKSDQFSFFDQTESKAGIGLWYDF